MNRLSALLLILSISIFTLSCNSEDEVKLKSIVKRDLQLTASDSIKDIELGLSQYQAEELKYNKKFVTDLESLVNTAFDKQLDKFEEEELGFFAGYGYMLSYFFKSKQSWEDEMRLKSDKYFSTVNIEQDAHELFTEYQKDTSLLRKRFWSKSKNGISPNNIILNLPEKNISLGALTSHSRNNVVIELISEGLERLGTWLLYPFVLWVLSLFLPNKIQGCIAKIVVFLISLVVSVVISMWNDNKLLNAIRDQNKEVVTIDYNIILEELNNNTYKFYESN